MILALTEGDEWLFLDPECSRRSLRDWTQHLEIRGTRPHLRVGWTAAAWSSYSLLKREHPGERGVAPAAGWEPLCKLGQEEPSRTTRGGRPASNAAHRLARAQGNAAR